MFPECFARPAQFVCDYLAEDVLERILKLGLTADNTNNTASSDAAVASALQEAFLDCDRQELDAAFAMETSLRCIYIV